jgi:hypothetical protein
MKKSYKKSYLIGLILPLVAGVYSAHADGVLTGDPKLACETILCLSTGQRPSECTPPLERYFSINDRKFSDTLRDRLDFLHQCPVSNQSPAMSGLVDAIANGAGRCDASSLNTELMLWTNSDSSTVYIDNKMPDYCSSYMNNSMTDLQGQMPIYIGTPDQGGFWSSRADYAANLQRYQEQQAALNAGNNN